MVAGSVVDKVPFEERCVFTPAEEPGGAHCCEFFAFNTFARLSGYGPQLQVEDAFNQVVAACRRYERLFSKTLPHSDIARLNAAGGTAVGVSEDSFRVLEGSVGYCRESQGCFDITLGPVIALWDYRAGIVPSQERIDAALAHVGWQLLELGGAPGARWARLADSLASVDVGGTAKGYIADRLCEQLEAASLRHFVVNLGGNVAARGGRPSGEPFSIGIRNPRQPSENLASVRLLSGSVVTSGLTARCFTAPDGTRYSHIIDPATGWPVRTDAESATIVAQSSFDADGYSTTLCSLGIQRGLAFAAQRPEIKLAVFIDADNCVHSS
ncbi:MAG: FAD:protein FMN transferase [Coriobacteriales bacterium]